MSKFATAMTWNGALSYEETSSRLSLYFKSIRGLDDDRLYQYLEKAVKEDIIDTFILAFHIRDCREGKGERDLGRKSLIWLFLHYPIEFQKIMPLIAHYGRWDDIMCIWPRVLNTPTKLHEKIQHESVKLMGNQLMTDLFDMFNGKTVTLCAKWAPTEYDSLDKLYGTVNTLCTIMGWTPKIYRKKYITPLRSYTKVVETLMCSQKWNDINFSTVPSCAMHRLQKVFEKNAPELYSEWKKKLICGQADIKAKQLYPHEIIARFSNINKDITILEEQWKILEQQVPELSDSLFIIDTSGSMSEWGTKGYFTKSFCPMDVSIAIGILGSNATKGPFHNHIISFNENPTFRILPEGTLEQRYMTMHDIPWGYNTNIQKTFTMILDKANKFNLSPEDMPSKIFIISDMQFDEANRGQTNFEGIDSQYKNSGYTRPRIIFWNVNGSSTDFPVTVDEQGTAMISGFSTAIFNCVTTSNNFTPYSLMRQTLDNDRYKPVKTDLNT